MAAILEAEALSAYYGPTKALHEIAFAVAEGGITAILGANGGRQDHHAPRRLRPRAGHGRHPLRRPAHRRPVHRPPSCAAASGTCPKGAAHSSI